MGENFIKIHGRLTRDVETKSISTKDANSTVANFSVAVNNAYPREDASFYNCYIFGKRAEALAKYFKKGSEIVCWGEHQQEPYEKDGKTLRPWKLKVDGFDFCGSSKNDKEQSASVPAFDEVSEEDLPF